MKIEYSFFSSNIVLLVLISTFSQPVVAEGLYKWVDKEGNVTYQSSPPPDEAANVERSKIQASSADEAQDDAAADTPSIELYSKIECPACDKARGYLEGQGLDFVEVVIEDDTVGADEMAELFGHTNVPTIKIGETSLTGYNKKTLARVLKNSGYEIAPEEEGQ
jgi:glutaredoxin